MTSSGDEKAVRLLEQALRDLEVLDNGSPFSDEFDLWWRTTRVHLQGIFGRESEEAKSFENIPYFAAISSSQPDDGELYYNGLRSAHSLLKSLIVGIREHGLRTTPKSGSELEDGTIDLEAVNLRTIFRNIGRLSLKSLAFLASVGIAVVTSVWMLAQQYSSRKIEHLEAQVESLKAVVAVRDSTLRSLERRLAQSNDESLSLNSADSRKAPPQSVSQAKFDVDSALAFYAEHYAGYYRQSPPLCDSVSRNRRAAADVLLEVIERNASRQNDTAALRQVQEERMRRSSIVATAECST